MALKIGNNAVANAFVGASQVRRAYKGGTLVFQAFGPASEQEFIQQEATGGPAQLLKVYGKTIVNNQMAGAGRTSNGVTAALTNGVYELIGTISTTYSACIGPSSRTLIAGHKYLLQRRLVANPNNLSFYVKLLNQSTVSSWDNVIVTAADAGGTLGISNATNGTDFTGVKIEVSLIDLTLRFGAGNEPTSVDEALRLLGGDAFDPTYDPGSLQSNKTAELRAERIPVINVWDEEWELGGFTASTGEPYPWTNRIRSINYIPVTLGSTLYIKGALLVYQYDSNANFISVKARQNSELVLESNCALIKFSTDPSAGVVTTYQNDICINLSDPAINGIYYPHWRGSLALNLSTLTGKLNGEGQSVVVFPDGLRGVGTDRDAAYGSTGEVRYTVVDLGSLTPGVIGGYGANSISFNITDIARSSGIHPAGLLCAKYPTLNYDKNNDKGIGQGSNSYVFIVWDSALVSLSKADIKAALSGVLLIYRLATPLTYTLDTPLPTDLTCVQGDILQRVSDNNCPFVGEMKFGL